jgi:hypothetical protein
MSTQEQDNTASPFTFDEIFEDKPSLSPSQLQARLEAQGLAIVKRGEPGSSLKNYILNISVTCDVP